MATPAEIRAWAREQGYDIGAKGGIPGDIAAAYETAHNGHAPPAPGPDYPDGMTDADFMFADAADPPGAVAETPPRRPPSGRGRGKAGKAGLPWARKGKGGGPRKPKHPRVSIEGIIGGAWRGLARLARPVPPLQRTLRVQAPVAGVMLEDALKGTLVDRALQPLARMQDRGKVAAALAGPPLLVTMISVHLAQCAQTDTEPNPLFMGMASEMLRESLIIWSEVAGPRFEEALARERRFEEEHGAAVDEFMAWLFAPPADPSDADAVAAEEDAIRRAQGVPAAAPAGM